MTARAPDFIVIEHDEYHTQNVGTTADGRQFFLTQPFVPAIKSPGRQFLAL